MKRMLYEDAIETAAFKKALAKSIKADPERKACKAGHDLIHPDKGHIHVGDLLEARPAQLPHLLEEATGNIRSEAGEGAQGGGEVKRFPDFTGPG